MSKYKPDQVVAESIMVSLASGDQLHIKRLRVRRKKEIGRVDVATPVLMLHGAVEDGRVFYSRRGKGLAYFLACHGFDVFVADLRGKGSSWPPLRQGLNRTLALKLNRKLKVSPDRSTSEYGAFEVVTQDLPGVVSAMESKIGSAPWIWVTHGWGGVVATAYMARYRQSTDNILGVVHFASRRTAQVNSFRKRVLIDWWWGRWGQWLVRQKGYLPGRFWGYGVADEAAGIHQDMIAWSNQKNWIDQKDGFDYQSAVLTMNPKPASLYFASGSDVGFADADDVRDFMKHHGDHDGRLVVLGKAQGNRRDYSAVQMLVHEDAEVDHFPLVVEWMRDIDGTARQQIQQDRMASSSEQSSVG